MVQMEDPLFWEYYNDSGLSNISTDKNGDEKSASTESESKDEFKLRRSTRNNVGQPPRRLTAEVKRNLVNSFTRIKCRDFNDKCF